MIFPDATGDLRLSGQPVSPLTLLNRAIRTNQKSISYTYTEPTIYFEICYDIAEMARETAVEKMLLSPTGFHDSQAIDRIAPYLDACDLFRDDFYKTDAVPVCNQFG